MIKCQKEDLAVVENMGKEISKEELMENWKQFMTFTPIHSGSSQEEDAAQFIKQKLEEYGLVPEILRYDSYLSNPKWARLVVLEPHNFEIQCTPYRQVGTTGAEGFEGEVIYLSPEEIGRTECRDKIVLAEQKTSGDWMGLRYPLTLKLQEMGIKGLIVIEQDTFAPSVIHQRADFSVSGNPTSDNIHRIQTIPAMVSVSNKDGQLLKAMTERGGIRVHLTSIVETGWKRTPLPVAEIKGSKDSEQFILVNGHIDTPPFSPGVVDNASGVVAILELARILNRHREKLGRTIRFAFWTAHEIGRYGGSTWYNDTFWHELRYHCIGSLNIDSPGAEGATTFRPAPIAEVMDIALDSIKAASGLLIEKSRWPARAGDSSFWNTGLPHASLTSTRPEGLYDPFVNFSGGGWWWHSAWATLDRGDIDVLYQDIKVNLNYIFRMTNCQILPMNFIPYADGIIKILDDLQDKGDKIRSYFNLYPVIEKAKEFKVLAASLEETVKKVSDHGAPEDVAKDLNTCIMWVSRHINQVAHSDSDKTDQMDMATFGALPFPRVQDILKLADMPLHQSPEFKFLQTKLLRGRNYVEDGFYMANKLIRETLARVEKEFP
jgi:N-acetylated-alpha-linked acidic dipeptidase